MLHEVRVTFCNFQTLATLETSATSETSTSFNETPLLANQTPARRSRPF
jgi:hypothetical protein